MPSQLRSGRPPATSHAAIESAAFALFEERGYEATTTEEIAERAGIGRRTLFRYFPAKADIPWGQFAEGLGRFRTALLAAPADEPIMTTIVREIIESMGLDRMQIVPPADGAASAAPVALGDWIETLDKSLEQVSA